MPDEATVDDGALAAGQQDQVGVRDGLGHHLTQVGNASSTGPTSAPFPNPWNPALPDQRLGAER
ncbi:MAG: hypothetical protein ACOYBU_08330, partial [Dermatophilaceae bacterium]